MTARSLLAALVLFAGVVSPIRAANRADSCQINDWFKYRDAAGPAKRSLLCRGILAASEAKRDEAEQELTQAIRTAPQSADAYEAHENLLSMFFIEGRFHKALRQVEQMIAEKPKEADTRAVHSILLSLGEYPDLSVASLKSSTVLADTSDGNVHIPVKLNGTAGTYILDTGSNISVMSESEAHRLGLEVKDTSSKLTDVSGAQTGSARVTEVEDLEIGETHLKHVAFIVLPDSNEPFVDLPQGRQGIIGIQPILAIGSFRLGQHGRFIVDPPPSATREETIPLAFDRMMPVAQVGFEGKKLNFTFDTGAMHTTLNPAFAREFPDLERSGVKKDHILTGFAGSTTHKSVMLRSLQFLFGRQVELAPATILLDKTTAGEWAAGNLGFDLMSQALPITVDFGRMQVAF